MPIKKKILIKPCYTHDLKKKFRCHKIVLFKAVNITISNC